GQLAIVNAENGQLQWTGKAPRGIGALRVFKGETSTALASITNRGLEIWDLEDPSTPDPFHFEAQRINASALATGDGVLFNLADQTAELYWDGELVLLDIPVPAVAAGVHDGTAIAVNHT